MTMIRTIHLAVLAALAAGSALAELPEKPRGFGNRPITIIVPYGPGGGSDQLSRAMATALEEVAGLRFQIVNKPGGGGAAAIPDFMLARADGNTILQHIDDAVTLYASGQISANPAEDWIPFCTTQITFNQIYMRPDETRFSDWESLAAFASANPGQVTIANLGALGAMERVVMAQLEGTTGLKFNQIAYDAPAERYGALIGGHTDLMFEQPGDVRSFLEAGQMVPILTLLDERPALFADVPTHREVGADFSALTRFRGFYVRAGTPASIVDYLEDACRAAFQTESYQAFNKAGFMDVIDSYRDRVGSVALINDSVEVYRAMYSELGIGQ
jgi:tripartite-type tricarboxylate transporter receptor subunit TctC